MTSNTDSNDDRIRRPELERTSSIRNFTRLLDQSDALRLDGAKQDEDTASYGARIGYRVIGEQIEIGKRAAREFSSAIPSTGNTTADIQQTIERLGRVYTDMLSSYAELLPPLASQLFGAAKASSASPEAASGANALPGTHVVVNVASPHKTRTTVELRSASQELTVTPLQAYHDPKAPLLSEVQLRSTGAGIEIDLHVPADATFGKYFGVVVDTSIENPVGTVTVELIDER